MASTIIDFPLYNELKELKGPELGDNAISAILSKIKQLDSENAEIVYAIIQSYAQETATRTKKSAKDRFGGSWLSVKPKRGVKFKVDKIPARLRKLLALYILYITGDPRMEDPELSEED